MTSAADKLNESSSSGYINFNFLKKDVLHKIHSFQTFKNTAFGKERLCIKAFIDGGYLILPERYDEKVEDLKGMDISKLHIIFRGREKGDKGRLLIEFAECEQEKSTKSRKRQSSSKDGGPSNKKKKYNEDEEETDEAEDEQESDEEEEDTDEEEPPKPSKKKSSKPPKASKSSKSPKRGKGKKN